MAKATDFETIEDLIYAITKAANSHSVAKDFHLCSVRQLEDARAKAYLDSLKSSDTHYKATAKAKVATRNQQTHADETEVLVAERLIVLDELKRLYSVRLQQMKGTANE